MKKKGLFRNLLKYMKGFHWYYIVGLLMMAFLVLVDLFIPYLTGLSLKYLGMEVIPFKKIIILIIVAGILIVASSIITYAQTIVLNLAGHRIILRIRSNVKDQR